MLVVIMSFEKWISPFRSRRVGSQEKGFNNQNIRIPELQLIQFDSVLARKTIYYIIMKPSILVSPLDLILNSQNALAKFLPCLACSNCSLHSF